MQIHLRNLACLLALFAAATFHPAVAQFDEVINSGSTLSATPDSNATFLPVDQAFIPSMRWAKDDRVQLEWYIEPGYYLYKNRFVYRDDKGVSLGASYPQGVSVFDEFYMQDLEVYYNQLTTPLEMSADTSVLYVQFQGCAEAGLCYPPTWVGFDIDTNTGAAGYQGELPAGPPQPYLAQVGAPSSVNSSEAEGDGLPITLIIGCLAGLLLLIGATVYAFNSSKNSNRSNSD